MLTIENFIEWANNLPEDKTFNYFDCDNCAIATFLRENNELPEGFEVGGVFLLKKGCKSDTGRKSIPFPYEWLRWLADTISGKPSKLTKADLIDAAERAKWLAQNKDIAILNTLHKVLEP